MRIENVRPIAVEPADERLPALVEPGEVVDVDDADLAAALLAQPANWSEAKGKAKAKAKGATPADDGGDAEEGDSK